MRHREDAFAASFPSGTDHDGSAVILTRSRTGTGRRARFSGEELVKLPFSSFMPKRNHGRGPMDIRRPPKVAVRVQPKRASGKAPTQREGGSVD